MSRPEALRHQNVDRLSDQFLACVAELVFDFGVDHHHFAGAVDHCHAARTGLHRQPEHFLGETVLDYQFPRHQKTLSNPVVISLGMLKRYAALEALSTSRGKSAMRTRSAP